MGYIYNLTKEAARLWADLVERHYRIRRRNLKWPNKVRWAKWAKKKYPNLNAQSVQQIIYEFCEAIESIKQLRKNGFHEAKYPWRKSKYRDVIYTNQSARIRNGFLILPNGNVGNLKIKMPKIELPGRLMEVRASFERIILICEFDEKQIKEKRIIGVDLGVNSVIAATDEKKAVVVSGREIKATIQWRNKRLASIQSKITKKIKGSRRRKRLARRKYKLLNKAHLRVKDAVHKATRIIADEFPKAKCYVGAAFNDAARKMAPKQAQQISQAVPGLIIKLLDYKTSGAVKIKEYYSSQTCPVCGERSKHARIFKCPKCGTVLPRDVVGSINNRRIGMDGVMTPSRKLPKKIVFKYPVKFTGSSGGHPASSSIRKSREAFKLRV